MNIRTDFESKLNELQCPLVFNAPCKNDFKILQGVNQIFMTQFNNIRSKWRDIQEADESTSNISENLSHLTTHVESVALRLKSIRSAVQEKKEIVNELNTELEALRDDYINFNNADQWEECKKQYIVEQNSIEARRIKQICEEREKLEHKTKLIRSKYRYVIAELLEVDENLFRIQTLNEELDKEQKCVMSKWQHSLSNAESDSERWKERNVDIRKEVVNILPMEGELKILKKDVIDLRKKVVLLQKRRKAEKMEYRRVKLLCMKAITKAKELENCLKSRDIDCQMFVAAPCITFAHKPVSPINTGTRTLTIEDNQIFDDSLLFCNEQISTTILNLDGDKNSNNGYVHSHQVKESDEMYATQIIRH